MVLDNNHGIETITYSTTRYAHNTDGGPKVVYLPWYIRVLKGSRNGYVTNYYSKEWGWKRVECTSWESAYNHIARSRGLPTSKQPGSTYAQEALDNGVPVG